jgi:hypothetical protein
MGVMNIEDRPPALDGIEWESTICPSCGNTWWQGRDLSADFDISIEEWSKFLGCCADCRGLPDEVTATVHVAAMPNRAARRAARHGRRR